MHRHKSKFSDETIVYILIAIAALFMGISVALPIVANFHEQVYVATVTDKDIKTYSHSSKYLVYTQTEEGKTKVFSVEDSPARLRWNSSDVYSEIGVGKTYRFTTIGFRIEFLSMYENIIDFQELSSGY